MANVIRVRKHGGPEVLQWETADVREPSAGEVRIVQEAVGVNYVDVMVRDGRYEMALPLVPGFEAAGVVEKVGPGVTSLVPGDRVGYFFSAGAYASERIVDVAQLIKLPQNVTTHQAGAYLAKGLTAWMGLRALYQLRPHDKVLVVGASGSVGSLLARWAKSLGATVIGVAGSKEKLTKVADGSTYAIYADDLDFLDKVKAVAPKGVDVVYDMVGRAMSAKILASIRSNGTIVSIGAISGASGYDRAELAMRDVQVVSGGTPQYVNVRTIGDASAELFAAVTAGVFSDIATESYPLQDAARVHNLLEHRSLTGLPVLIP